MIHIAILKHSGCCDNCMSAVGEKEIFRISAGDSDMGYSKLEICKDCFPEFVKEVNEAYTKMFERKE